MSKQYLSTTDRPVSLQQSIDELYESLHHPLALKIVSVKDYYRLLKDPFHTESSLSDFYNEKTTEILSSTDSKLNKFTWTKHGSITYQNMLVPEADLVKQIIVNNYRNGQKEFVILEPGAGSFHAIEIIAKAINKATLEGMLPNDISVTIIGTRAEPNLLNENTNIQNCDLYKLGNFKYENLLQAIHDKGFDHIIGKVDFIFSNYTWQHFYDWVGTLVDTYKLLKPLGIMMYHHKNLLELQYDDNTETEHGPLQTTEFIVNTLHSQNNEILVKQHPDGSYYSTIITFRKHTDELLIPMSYHPSNYLNRNNYTIKLISSNMKHLPSTSAECFKEVSDEGRKYKIFGDKSLFALISETLLSKLVYDAKCVNLSDNTSILSQHSDSYSADDLQDYTKSEFGGYYECNIPQDILPYDKKYKANTVDDLKNNLQHEISTVIEFIEGKTTSFQYQGNEYHLYDYPYYTLTGEQI